MYHRFRSPGLSRFMAPFVALALVCAAMLAGPAPRAYADDDELSLFRADFGGAPLGPVTTLRVEQGTVVAQEGLVAVASAGSGRALTVDGTGGQATALLQFSSFPGALPGRDKAPQAPAEVLVEAEFTTNISGTTGGSFGLLAGATFYEFFSFSSNGALVRAGAPLGLTAAPGSEVKLELRLKLDGGQQKMRMTLASSSGKKNFDLPLDGAFTVATINQLRLQAPAGTGLTALDKVEVDLNTDDDDDDDEPPAVIVIREGDVEQAVETVGGVVFVNISITVVNSGGSASGTFLVFDLDDLDDFFELADVSFLEGAGFVQRIEAGQVFVGLGQNNVLDGKVKVKVKFKAKRNGDVKVNARFRLNFNDSSGGREIAFPPIVVVVQPVVVAPVIVQPVVITPTIVLERLPISRIDVRFRPSWERRGGLAIFGLPLTEPITGTNGIVVQYFERARLEYHPELRGTPYVVLLGLLAVELRYTQPPTSTTAPTSTAELRWYFPATGHVIAPTFRSYWQGRGGLPLFGLPISGVVIENGRQVQYFERARLEFHPENRGTPYEVQLGLLGVQLLERERDDD